MTVASASKDKVDQFESSDLSTRSLPSGPGAKQDVDVSSEASSSVQSGETLEWGDVDILTQVLLSRSEEHRLLFCLPPDDLYLNVGFNYSYKIIQMSFGKMV